MKRIEHGDMREVLDNLIAEGVRVSSIVTDPPYGLGFMGKRWDGARNVAFELATWKLCYELLPPGGHLIAFGGTRTYHRLVCAIEDAGFEIRDQLAWIYGSGFPKSHNVSKGIDKARHDDCRIVTAFLAGHRRDIGLTAIARALGFQATEGTHGVAAFFTDDRRLARVPKWDQWLRLKSLLLFGDEMDAEVERLNDRKGQPSEDYASRPDADYAAGVGMSDSWTDGRGWSGKSAKGGQGVRDAARQWEGWGTALKPAFEPIVLARKPLVGTVAGNVLAHGTGVLNIDGCRVDAGARPWREARRNQESDDSRNAYGKGLAGSRAIEDTTQGRWPANVVHDGSDEVVKAFPNRDVNTPSSRGEGGKNGRYGSIGAQDELPSYGDTGSAARFFYSAKADADDRLGSKHPTVKPVDLMRWLVRLITPPAGVVLDPFAGSGSTAMACLAEGFDFIMVEQDADSVADIRRRLAHVRGDDTPLFNVQTEA